MFLTFIERPQHYTVLLACACTRRGLLFSRLCACTITRCSAYSKENYSNRQALHACSAATKWTAVLQVTLNLSGAGAVADVAVSGLPGWVALRTEQSGGRLVLRVWAPVGIEAYVRPPLPVPQSVR